ncbi:MAG: pitrilysin family protein [Armatimonadota bacterium]|nr:pitrilysin family protein [Armatimonadota bacterium]MDR7484948.1 pitrilysin family protein [Armatimonadota bacterium]MDR7535462.1 pitrilysin family protein [Armatimonadota bacterium]
MIPVAAATIRRMVLRNGLVVLVRATPGSGSVAVAGFVRAGGIFDGDRPGLGRLAGVALMHGTHRRTARQLAEELDGLGATLVVAPGLETTSIGGRALPDDLGTWLDLAADVLMAPAYAPDEVEKVRGQLITAARVNALDTRHAAERLFRRLAFPPAHPHSQAPDGEETVLAALLPQDLHAFHRSYVTPQATALAIVGDVDAGRTADLAAARFEAWPAGAPWALPAVPEPARPPAPQRQEVTLPGKTQADLVLGTVGISRTAPGYYAAMMANLLLGQLGMMGRIGEHVRERQGIAYYAFSDLRAGLLAGPWWVRAGVNPANLERAVEAILTEIAGLAGDGPTEEELADARRYLVGSMAVRLETNQGIAQALAEIELYGLGLDYLERYPALVEGIARDDVVAAMRRFPTDAYTLAIAAPEPPG